MGGYYCAGPGKRPEVDWSDETRQENRTRPEDDRLKCLNCGKSDFIFESIINGPIVAVCVHCFERVGPVSMSDILELDELVKKHISEGLLNG